MKTLLDIFILKLKEKLNSDLFYLFPRKPLTICTRITTLNPHLLNFTSEECLLTRSLRTWFPDT